SERAFTGQSYRRRDGSRRPTAPRCAAHAIPPVYTANVAEPAHRLSYGEYLELEAGSDQRYEFIDGVAYAMAGGTPEHSRLAAAMIIALGIALADRGCTVYTSDLKLRIDATNRSTYADAV